MRTEVVLRRGIVMLVTVVTAAGSGGCSTMNNTEKGVGLGAAIGAGTGTLIGAATHNPKTGAVVGGLLGAGVGGAIGNDMDRKDQEKKEVIHATAVANAQAAANAQRMGMTDVIQMVQQGHDPQVIINQIRNTGSTFQLSASDLDMLRANNVPPQVIIEMQNARAQPVVVRPSRPVVVQQSPEVIYTAPPPPPPVVVVGRPYYRPYGYRYYW